MSLILVAVEDRGEAGTVARVTVNNAAERNALGNAGKRELAEAIEHVSADPRLRAIVLTGAGDRSFIGGANVTEMATFTHGHASEGPSLTHRVCEAIRRAPVPVIARVNGYCFGAGLEIAASCDMRAAADTAAPRVSGLLTGIRIARDRADPNSLLNRPAKVMVAAVTGAPGDGNAALTKNIRANLTEYGLLVQTTKDGADFLVRGEVTIVPIPDHKERVEIVWTVDTAKGEERGKVAQLNEIPAGILNGFWGEVATAVAAEAAGGLNDVLIRQTGREEAAKVDAAKAPPAK